MEIAPTCHYIMGGVRVDADTAATSVPGLFAAGEVAGGMHGSNRLGGNSLSDLLVFGRRAGLGACEYVSSGRTASPLDGAAVDATIEEAIAPFSREEGDSPYDVQHDLQDLMQRNVGIIRTGTELTDALAALDALSERVANLAVRGGRAYNPGWNLATDLPSMLTVSRCTTLGAINRTESRGGHTREDYPSPDAELGKVNFVHSQPSGGGYRGEIKTVPEPIPEMAPDLRALFEDNA